MGKHDGHAGRAVSVVSVDVLHATGLRFAIRTRDVEVWVDRTPEEGGLGPGFRSAELLLGALGACALGNIVTFAANTGIELSDARAVVAAREAEHPSRLESLAVMVDPGRDLSLPTRQSLERVAQRCKVHNTLHRSPDIALTINRNLPP